MALLAEKRILVFTESYGDVNGVSRTTNKIVEYLKAQGGKVVIVAPKSLQTCRPTDDQIRVSGYPLPMNPELSLAYPVRIDRLIWKASSLWEPNTHEPSVKPVPTADILQPDLIYIVSPASLGYQILLQLRLLSSIGIPQVPIIASYETDLATYALLMLPRPFSTFSSWVLTLVEGSLYSHRTVQKIFYPCHSVRDYLVGASVPEAKLTGLARGVDTNLFSPARADPGYKAHFAGPDGKLVLLSVCRLSHEKGFDFLAQVAHKLHAHQYPFHLHIVGSNPSPTVVSEIQSLFAALPKDTITFSGLLEGEDLARAYASADVFVHSSISETFGLVVLEAMASGLPIIARDQGGPSDIVRHGKVGFLVPPNDLDGFVARIEEFGEAGALGRTGGIRMGAEGRIEAENTTWDTIGDKVAHVMSGALQQTPSESPGAILTPGVAGVLVLGASVVMITSVWAGTTVVYIFSRVHCVVRDFGCHVRVRLLGWSTRAVKGFSSLTRRRRSITICQ